MNLTQEIKQAIIDAESSLSERELRDHIKLRTSVIDILRWLQCRKVGFIVHKPSTVSPQYLPEDLCEYLKSEYCQEKEILIPYVWEVDCDYWKDTGENRNFWHICKTSFSKGCPMQKQKKVMLGSPNTWERGRD